MMYVVLEKSKTVTEFEEVIPLLQKEFPLDVFVIHGDHDSGYQLRILGYGDEKKPRAFVKKFIKIKQKQK